MKSIGEDIPQIKVGNKLYSIGDLVDKTMIANVDTKVYRLPIEKDVTTGLFDALQAKKDQAPVYTNKDNVQLWKADAAGNYTVPYRIVKDKGNWAGGFDGFGKGYFLGMLNTAGQDIYIAQADAAKFPAKYYKDVQNYLRTVKKGESIGVLYSWVHGKDAAGKDTGEIWLMFEDINFSLTKKYVYVLHTANLLSKDKLEQQGIKDTETQIEEQADADKPWYEKLGEGLEKKLVQGFLIGVGAYVVVKIAGAYIAKPKQPQPTQKN